MLSWLDEIDGVLTGDIALALNVPDFIYSYGLAVDEEHQIAVVSVATDQLLHGDAAHGGIDTVLYRVNLDTSAVEATLQFGNADDQWPALRHSVVLLHDRNAIFVSGYSGGVLYGQSPPMGHDVFVMKLTLDLQLLWFQYIEAPIAHTITTAMFYSSHQRLLYVDLLDPSDSVTPKLVSVNVDYGVSESTPAPIDLSDPPVTFTLTTHSVLFIGSILIPSHISLISYCLPSINTCECPLGYAGVDCTSLSTCSPHTSACTNSGSCADSLTCHPETTLYTGTNSTQSRRPFVSLTSSLLYLADHQYHPPSDSYFTLVRIYNPSNMSLLQDRKQQKKSKKNHTVHIWSLKHANFL